MIRLAAAGALLALTAIAGSNAVAVNDSASADLHIVNVGTTARYVTLGLPLNDFTLDDGGVRHFRNLKPGRYVVVLAPPIAGYDQWIRCSSGEMNQVDLSAGDDVTCTFTLAPSS